MPVDAQQDIVFGPFRLDRRSRGLTRAGVPVPLRGRAFDVLTALAMADGETVGKDALLDQVWPGLTVEENNLQVQISALRKLLGEGWITTLPGRGYRLAAPPAVRGIEPELTLALPDRPSIAVLPFQNMSGDPGQQYFADGVADDIIAELSRDRRLFVIARSSSFTYRGKLVDVRQVGRELGVRYVLEGSVRRAGRLLRVAARLNDAPAGSSIWAERYDRSTSALFAVQDEVVAAIKAAVDVAVADAEQHRALRKPPGSLSAWETYQRGMWQLSRGTPEDIRAAIGLFRAASQLDDLFTAPLVAWGWAMVFLATVHVVSDPRGELVELEVLARKVATIDPTDADAQALVGYAQFVRGDAVSGLVQIDRATALNATSPTVLRARGTVLGFARRAAEAIEALRTYVRLNPRDPFRANALTQLAVCQYFARDYEASVDAARQSIAAMPEYPLAYRWLAASLGQLGRTGEARVALETTLRASRVSFEFYTRRRPPWFSPEDHAHMMEGLRKAGWNWEE